jgi:LmbE family N-acetylglucosaminyl deacetylase
MSQKILVIAPHPDDETLGCGGTLLKHSAQGDEIHWLIVTGMLAENGYSEESIIQREQEINEVSAKYPFKTTTVLHFPAASLDQISTSILVLTLSKAIQKLQPEVVYVPFRNDAHSDHQITFDAISASCKSFRTPFIKKILAYETLSETDFNLKPGMVNFTPNVWVNISTFLEEKLEILGVYNSELQAFPFPRSEEAVIAQAKLRGVQANCKAAEAFWLLKEIIE